MKRSRVFDPEQLAGAFPLIQNSDCVEIYLRIIGNNIDARIFGGRGGTRSPQRVASAEAALPPVSRAFARHLASSSEKSIQLSYGLGAGVGRGLGVGCDLGVGVGLGVGVAVGVRVAVGVGLAVAVAVGVAVGLAVAVAVGVGLIVGVGVGVPPPEGDTRT